MARHAKLLVGDAVRYKRVYGDSTVNTAARSLAKQRDTIVHHTDYSIYGLGLGLGFRF